MNLAGEISDIPKVYTAIAEWVFCAMYVLVCLRRAPRPSEWARLAAALVALCIVQLTIGVVPVALWLPGMGVALAIMFLTIWTCCAVSPTTAAYWLVKAFVLAEFAASLEWQLYFYLSTTHGWRDAVWLQAGFLILVYGLVFGVAFVLEARQDAAHLDITPKELRTPVIIAITTFALSNLSYVSSSTPFSGSIGAEAFNIRTLVGLGGVAFLYAYHNQLSENHTKAELDSIRGILRMQYSQYRQSKESIDIINHKYHDLKHQIAVLRSERDPRRREMYLDDIEQGVREYEAQFKTGNAVLDTIVRAKALHCARHGIELTCVADGALLDGMNEMDISTIFGNALDNAIECEERIADETKRLIHVSVSRFNDFVLIRVENYMAGTGSVRFRDGLPVTTKTDRAHHGFGLKSIQHVASKCGGTVTVQVRENWFELKVIIGL